MHRSISVLQVKLSGEYLLHPFGTFSSYGGYVGIYPYRLLAADCTDEELGMTVTELLKHSKATGYQIKEIEKYRSDQNDSESDLLRERYFGTGLRNPTAKFRNIDVSLRSGSKSITLSLLRESKHQEIGQPEAKVRVPLSSGETAIGFAIRKILNSTV